MPQIKSDAYPDLRSRAPRNLWGALGLLAAGLIVIVLASLYIKTDVDAAAQREFDFTCNEIRLNIDARLVVCAQILRSGAALFDASESVEREEWRAFTHHLEVEQQLPGIQGVGFSLLIPREQLAQHIQGIRAKGFPAYEVRPAGERETYSSIIYLEPFTNRNLRAFGYDMFSEPVRRAAMERARDENTTALSGKVILVQETGQKVQAGTLMYVPVYRHGLPIETIEQRRAAIQGWVYSPYRMTDLMRGTLRNWDVEQEGKQIHLQVFDGDAVSADTLLYDSQSDGDKAPTSTASLTRLTPVDFAGHRWTLRFTQIGGLASSADYSSVWLVLFGGTIINLLLFGLMLSWLNTRAKARQIAERLTAELRESRNKYLDLFDSAGDAIFIHDKEARILEVNRLACERFGYTQAELTSMTINMVDTPEQGVHAPDRIARLMEQGSLTFETIHQRKDGSPVSTEVSARRITWNGQPAMMSICRDTTERKRAEEKLLELRAAVDQAFDGIAIADMEGCINFVNSSWAKMHGYSKDQLVGKPLSIFHTKEQLERQVIPFSKELVSRGAWEGEVGHVRKDGTVFPSWMSASVLRNNKGVPEGLIGMARDISEHKQAEEALKESEALFRNLLQDVQSIAVQGYGPDGTTQYWNQASERLYGYSAQEAIGRNLLDLVIPPEMRRDVEQAIRQMAETGQPIPASELSLMRKDGSRVSVFSNHTIVQTPGGAAMLFCLDVDISERKKAEEALRQQTEELYSRNDALNRFNRAAVGRELRMMELKREVNDLCVKLGEPPRHQLAEDKTAPPASTEAQA